MSQNKTQSRIIKLSKLDRERIVIENDNEFETSVFKYVYNKAELLLKDIVFKNYQNRDKKGKEEEAHIDNVISFEGRRGTGKTSAMMSIRDRWYNNGDIYELSIKNENIRNDEEEKNEKVRICFNVIDYIDASMLENGEDILEIVLANMFSKLLLETGCGDQSKREHERNKLYRYFDDAYGALLHMKETRNYNGEESPLHMLTQLSNSQILKKKIKQLVECYLHYMGNGKTGQSEFVEQFLIITIDDLDMRFQQTGASPFEMLETIHRYLMIPGIVILLTYNYTDLCRGCEKHFYAMYHPRYGNLADKDKKSVRELVSEYLEKILPIYARIDLPSLKKMDYVEEDEIFIQLESKEVNKYLGDFVAFLPIANNERDVNLSPKRFIFLLKASIAGIFYDAAEDQTHFSVPSDLRELAQVFVLYRQLYEIKKNTPEYMNALFKEILDDLYFRYVKEKLSFDEEERFRKYLDVPVEKRSRNILSDIHGCFRNEGKQFSEIVYCGLEARSYSYGELLYGLYCIRETGWFSEELIGCILDSYTIVLTKLYQKMRANQGDGREKYRNRLLKIIGVSVASSWSNIFLPKVQMKSPVSKPPVSTDYTVRRENREKLLTSASAAKFTDENVKWVFELENTQDIKKIKQQLQILEILRMFYTEVRYRDVDEKVGLLEKKGFKIEYNSGYRVHGPLKINDSDELANIPNFKLSFSDCCFNIMNFVGNLLNGEEFFSSFHENILEGYKQYLKYLNKQFHINSFPVTEGKIRNFLKDNSLYTQFKKWDEKTTGLAMPIYSMDIMYNIFVRQSQNRETMIGVSDIRHFWKYMVKVYEEIGIMLKAEDEFYYSDNINNIDFSKTRFYKAYNECPFISYINALKTNRQLNEDFEKHFTDMMSEILPHLYKDEQ